MRISPVVAIALLASTASAQVTPIGPFTGTDQEPFQTQSGTAVPCVPGRIFNNQADLCTPAGNGVYLTSGWSFICSLSPHGGNKMCGTGGATSGGGIDITFDTPLSRFGGYFGMNHSGNPDITVTFYLGGSIVSGPTVIPLAIDCQWHWLGWQMGGAGVDRIHLESNHSSTGYLHMDDLEADFGPTCLTQYGSGCPGSGGFVPTLDAAGCATAGSNITIQVSQGLGGATALLLLGATQAATPIGFGCTLNVSPVYPAIVSFPLSGSGAGNGTVSLFGPIPSGTTGVTVVSQVFVIDPGTISGFAASNGLQFDIQ